MCRLALFASLVCTSLVAADNWALLVAGSNGYYNYRHQADVCHSYQVLKANGFSDDRIITMFYDDIANNQENPVKDNLINQPNGPNVYTGCKKDYTGDAVTPQNFLKILAGKSMTGIGSGKTLKTTAEDNIFVFFSDHGATGIIAFPYDELHALDLNTTITEMSTNKQFKQMLIYIEACEAGSMFNNILSDKTNVLAVTASDPTHSSYAIYYDDTRQTYLGDVFSVYWMQDSESQPRTTETIGTQFNDVEKLTNTSQVCAYGDLTIKTEKLALFQSPPQAVPSSPRATFTPLETGDMADSRDVTLAILRRRLAAASPSARPRAAALLSQELARREMTDRRMAEIIRAGTTLVGHELSLVAPIKADLCHTDSSYAVNDAACLKQMIVAMKSFCGPFDDYTLKHVKYLNALCNAGLGAVDLIPTFTNVCSHTN